MNGYSKKGLITNHVILDYFKAHYYLIKML